MNERCNTCIKQYDCDGECDGYIKGVEYRCEFEYKGEKYLGITYNWDGYDGESFGVVIQDSKGIERYHTAFAPHLYKEEDFIKTMESVEYFRAIHKEKKV